MARETQQLFFPRSFRPSLLTALLSALLAAGSVQAQSVSQPPVGAVPRAEDLKQQLPADTKADPSLKDLRAVPKEVSKPLDDVRIDVSRYAVEGGPPELAAMVDQLTQPFVGKDRGFEDLSNAAETITRYLQAELGLYLAYAYLPQQSIENGIVKITVLSGVLDRVILKWNPDSLVDKEVVESYLSTLKPGSVIRVSEIERVVFLLNDLRGINLSFEIQPGTEPGTAALVVTPTAQKRYNARIGVDNFGSRFVGTNRINATVSVESPLGRGDALTLSHLRSFDSGLDFSLASYSLPIGNDGLKVGTSVSKVNYELSQSEFPLGLNGEATIISVFTLYPVKRSRNFNLFVTASTDRKRYDDRATAVGLNNQKEITTIQAGVSGDSRDALLGGGINSFDISYVSGTTEYITMRPIGLDDSATFQKTLFAFSRLQTIEPNRVLALASVKGQSAANNLDVSEACRLGGPDGVRAFSSGEAAGDTCVTGTLEGRYLPKEETFGPVARQLAFSVFYDYGYTRLRKDLSLRPLNFENERTIAGYGVGVIWNPSSLTQARATLAWRDKGDNISDTKGQTPRIYVSVQTGF